MRYGGVRLWGKRPEHQDDFGGDVSIAMRSRHEAAIQAREELVSSQFVLPHHKMI